MGPKTIVDVLGQGFTCSRDKFNEAVSALPLLPAFCGRKMHFSVKFTVIRRLHGDVEMVS